MITMILRSVLLIWLLGYFTPGFANDSPGKVKALLVKADQMPNSRDALKLAQQGYFTAKKLNCKQCMVWALRIMASKTMDLGDWKGSLVLIDTGVILANEINDIGGLAHLNTIKGYSFTKIGFFSEGKAVLLEAETYSQRIPNPDERFYRLGLVYTNLGVNYEESGTLKDSLIFYNKLAYTSFKKVSGKYRYQNALGIAAHNYGATLSLFRRFDSASYYLQEAIRLGIKGQNLVILGLAYNSMGKMFFRKKDYSKSIDYYHKSLSAAITHNNDYLTRDAYEGLGNSYAALKKQDSSTLFLGKAKLMSDSLAKTEKSSIQTSMESIKRVDEQKQYYKKMIFIFVLAVVLVLFILSFTGYLTFFKKFKKVQLDKTELECLLNEKMFLLQEQSGLPKSDAEELKYIVHLAMTNDPCFFVKFKEFDSLFIKKLLAICPKLVATELELCALLRLNFETKEIARYTRQSVRAVESKKFRIRKKLNVSSDVDLNIWMSMV
ncbi:hypothetical protein [Pedobacter gandavensis]|uniref:tetratricopeptide repeat protein n=1 Tax=Pedobacter gandavensis TaxID=2679963 RepID=UPI00292FC21C|nr:hypothetical protein [Pedobacter gandavensis]